MTYVPAPTARDHRAIKSVCVALAVLALCAGIMSLGTPAMAATTTFTWGSPQDLTTPDLQPDTPQIVAGDNGKRLTAVWAAGTGGNPVIYASSSSDAGTTWSTPAALSDNGGAAAYPQISSSADGMKLVVLWSRADANDYLIESARSSDGGATWNAPEAISAPNGRADIPQVVSSADGNKVTAVWVRFDGNVWVAQTSSSPDGGAYWDGVTSLSASGQDAAAPQIASSADGTKLTATWHLFGVDTYVQTRTSTDSGANWSAAVNVSTSGGNSIEPDITSSGDGEELAIAFTRTGSGSARIQVSRSDDGGGSWSVPTTLSADGQDAQNARIVGSADGEKLYTSWSRSNGTNGEVQTAHSSNTGASWSSPTTVSSAGVDSSLPRISAAQAGSTVGLTWEALKDGKSVIQSSITADAGSTWSSPVQLSSSTASSDQSQIAAATDGTRFAAVWKRAGDSDTVIQTASATASTIPDSGKRTPAAANGCVTPGTPKSIPRKGTKQLMKPSCTTTGGERIGVTVKGKLRGDIRTYNLFCKRENKRPTPTQRLANGARYCKSGALKIRTYGTPLALRITWKAPATSTYKQYLKSRSYRT